MGTLEHIIKKYSVDTTKGIVELPIGRFKDLPRLFGELGFKVGAEVGVYRGLYAKYLCRYTPGLKLFGIDIWTVYDAYKDYNKDDIIDAEKEAREVAKKYNVELIKGRSIDVVKQFEDESLDFVFIDGNHAYEYVVEDIAAWSKKVRKGGIVAGHDFDDYSKHGKRWMDMHVIDAVKGWCKSYRIAPLFITTKNSNKCWFYVKQ